MSIRTERVARLLQREIAGLILSDFSTSIPGLVTVTGVRVTKDLSIAYVYLSVMASNAAERTSVFDHVLSLTSAIRGALGNRIRHQVRKIPELKFFLDDSLEKAARLDSLFADIRAEKESRSSDDADA